jgi:hypothetical protein
MKITWSSLEVTNLHFKQADTTKQIPMIHYDHFTAPDKELNTDR